MVIVFISGVVEAPESVILHPDTASSAAAISKKVNPDMRDEITKDLVFYIVFFDFAVKCAF